ncbi:hypothetical protein ASPZODRAFT_73283 [Penicilliopsis zonata CBS 506.65]|uniref:Association with the SNF1 complex (ASC) domain-containing protein n=1 Tax=Penicilliopsis zonata CBS 506.65 TaxID=1073090 RepID=A0A1L9S9D5_9EURO|nr:hypothetical protein ASPZODRAFT_73283 [Penicilliopsis zonata CBS 506.65]OJJ43764.1 hypothetical protein ASPZODRAFT_73283 [Penicilliopsis zonata CBS 506.65]
MGNNPSKSPSGDPSSTSGHSNLAVPPGDKTVRRRPSINALSGAKATAADPSASKENATGVSASQRQASAHHRLQSRNITDLPSRGPRPDQRDARRSEARPLDVPPPNRNADASVAPSGPPLNTYYGASAHLQRPPRMPLPIGDANATPGSPIIGPADTQMESIPTNRLLDERANPEATNFTSATVDEEDLVDELQPYAISGVGRAVPTTIDWTGPGNKVYVTGTFVNWEKKFRLHRKENEGGPMSITLNLRPGTHHLKFIVDGDMRASDNLPTAVDFTNHLVNYIEVSADDVSRSRRESDRTTRSSVPPGLHPPQVLPEVLKAEQEGDPVEDGSDKEEPEEEIPIGDFRRIIPQFLVDIDQDDETPAYTQAVNVISDTPTPPSLPLFLGKSILNGTTPMKDDSSVLNYPNHTVLNHLATSSIKNGVLATSVTTRYKRKYVTTILYKPTGEIQD